MIWKHDMFRDLFKAQFARKVTVLAAGTALGQGIVLLASPVLARIYTSADFGVLAVFSATLGILSVLATLRYEEAIPLPRRDEEALPLLVLSLGILGVIVIAVGLGVWLAGDLAVALLNVPALKPYLWLLPLALAGMGCYQVLNNWAVRKAAFHDIAVTKVSQGLALALVQVVVGLLHRSPLGLVLGDFAGRVAGSGMLFKVLRRSRLNIAPSVSRAALKTPARVYWKFPAYTLPNALLNTVSQSIPNLLLSSLFSPAVAGCYFFALQVTSAPLTLISKSVAQVFFQNAAEKHSQGQPLTELVRQVHWRLLWMAVAPSLVLMAFAPALFGWVFGAEWRMAGEYLRYLVPWLAALFVVSPTTYVFAIVNKQETMLVFELVVLALRVLAIVGGAHYSANPVWAIALFGAVGFLANLYMRRLVLAACRTPPERHTA